MSFKVYKYINYILFTSSQPQSNSLTLQGRNGRKHLVVLSLYCVDVWGAVFQHKTLKKITHIYKKYMEKKAKSLYFLKSNFSREVVKLYQ